MGSLPGRSPRTLMSADLPTTVDPASQSVPDAQVRRQSQVQLGTESWQIGRFRARPGTALFSSNAPPGHDAIVFPRRAVQIRREDGCSVLASPSKVLLHHAASSYRRTPVDPEGDECVWYWLDPELRDQITHDLGPTAHQIQEAAAHCPRRLFRAERQIWCYVSGRLWESGQGEPDWLLLEEAVLEVARGAIETATRDRARTTELDTSAARFNVDRADAYLAGHFHLAPTLDDIAAAARCSKFHLARLYRALRGRTLHAARTDLQLRAAYDLVLTTRRPMTEIASDLGFSSASHFSTRFLQAFGQSPTALRGRPGASPRQLP